MSAVRSKDTLPEMLVRRMAHGMGYRYRLHVRDLAGKPDLVFPKYRKVIFVHGCFWHGHHCERGRRPSSNTAFWNTKLDRNLERDRLQQADLKDLGWDILIIWECETRNAMELRSRLRSFLS